MTTLHSYIDQATHSPLNIEQARDAFDILFKGEASPVLIAGFLMALRTRGEHVDEITGAAQAMRANCRAVTAPAGAIDIVGTGGDGKATLNISTAAAFVAAGADVVIAKHGNKNLSSLSGAADALSVNGVEVMVPPGIAERAIATLGIGFMMAPMHHPAMKHVGPVRAELRTRTIFNILGPLTNPAGVTRQLTGAFSPDLLRPMAETLRQLGSTHAWLVHGGDGTDELSICGESQVVVLENGKVNAQSTHPEEFGLPTHPFDAIKGGDPAFNGAALRQVLLGEKSAYRDAVLLNSAAALLVSEKTKSPTEAVDIAKESIDSGRAIAKLDALARLTQEGVPA